MPPFIEDSAFFIKHTVCAFLASEIVREVFGQFKTELPVKPVVRLIGIDDQHILSFLLICSRKKSGNSALSASAFSAKYYLHS